MSDASEVKRAIYMCTGVSRRKNYDMIINLIERLLPNGEIKVTTPELQELERIVAERDELWKRATKFVMPGEMDTGESIEHYIKTLEQNIARQARVIEKLKGMVPHYETCATVDRYDDEEVPCDCGLEKELEAIEQGEGT